MVPVLARLKLRAVVNGALIRKVALAALNWIVLAEKPKAPSELTPRVEPPVKLALPE